MFLIDWFMDDNMLFEIIYNIVLHYTSAFDKVKFSYDKYETIPIFHMEINLLLLEFGQAKIISGRWKLKEPARQGR